MGRGGRLYATILPKMKEVMRYDLVCSDDMSMIGYGLVMKMT